jgi:hypothetical protein
MDPADLEQMVARENLVAKEKLVAKENLSPHRRTPSKQQIPGTKYGSPGLKFASPVRQEKVKIIIPSSPVISLEEQRSRSQPTTPVKVSVSPKHTLMTPDDFSPEKGGFLFKHIRAPSPAGRGVAENPGSCSPAKATTNSSPLTLIDNDSQKFELLPPSVFMVSRDVSKMASPTVASPRLKAARIASLMVQGSPHPVAMANSDDSSSDKEEELIEIRNTLQKFGNYKQRLG